MKFSDIILTANKNLLKNKIRSFLTILAIFVGSFTIILNSAISAGVNDYVDAQINSMGGDGYLEMMPTAMIDSMSSMMSANVREYSDEKQSSNESMFFTDEQLEKAKKIDGVIKFTALPNSSIDYISSENTDKKYEANINLVVDGIKFDMLSGVSPNTDDDAPYEIAINENLIEPLGFKDAEDAVGKTVKIGIPHTALCYTVARHKDCQTEVKAKVSGVQATGILSMGGSRANVSLWNRIHKENSVGMPAETANRFYQATAVVEPEKINDVKEAFKELKISALSVDDEVGAVRGFLDAVLVILNIFGGIALVAAAIGIINTLFMAVQERTREIGLMKALGMSRAKIFLSFSVEAISLGFWGSVFGTIVSMSIGYAANSFLHTEGMFLEDFPTFKLVSFTPEVIVPIIVFVMFIAFVAGTAPALKAARKNPIDALRYE